MVDFIKITENKKKMLEKFRVIDFNDIYYDKAKNDLVYEKSKMTMYIENIGKKINSNFPNFIKKHIVSYVCAPDKKGNILCYDCDEMCRNCYKCVDCVSCSSITNSIKVESAWFCSFSIDCIHCSGLYFSKKCKFSGENLHEDKLISYSIFLDNCVECRECFNLIDCCDCDDCIDCRHCKKCKDCIDCEDCEDCRDCKRSFDLTEEDKEEDRNLEYAKRPGFPMNFHYVNIL